MKHLRYKLHLFTWVDKDDAQGGGDPYKPILEACKSGDRKAQKRLFDRLSPAMMSVCVRYMGDYDTAQDVLQEGFITLFTKLDSYSGAGSFEGWARKIFVNTALMQLRKTDAIKLSEDISEARSLSSEEATPLQTMGYRELMRLIAMLPPDARTVFNMYVVEGYTHKEIADITGMAEATSRSKLQRARVRLQELIRERNLR